jgi:putative endonuclease
VGQTQDLERRLREHREGVSFYTKRADDWELVHTEELPSRSEAMKREIQLKSSRGRAFLFAPRHHHKLELFRGRNTCCVQALLLSR